MNDHTANLNWLQSTAEAWAGWMLPMSIQLLVVVGVVYAMDSLLGRRAWPKLLAALWCLVLLKLVVPPSLSSPLSVAQLIELPAMEVQTPVATPLLANSSNSEALSQSHVLTESSAALRESERPGPQSEVSAYVVLFLVWLIGCGLLAVLITWRGFRTSRRLRSAPNVAPPQWLQLRYPVLAAQVRLRSIPRLRIIDAAVGPAVFGVLRPVIVLPAALVKTSSREELEHVLLHELAHIKRRDPVWDLVSLVLSIAYWFHPGVWLARRRLSSVRELRCDEAVMAALGDKAQAYRRTLLAIAQPLWAPSGLSFFPRRSQLVERAEHLACGTPPHAIWRKLGTATTVLVLAICVVPLGVDERAVEASSRMRTHTTSDEALESSASRAAPAALAEAINSTIAAENSSDKDNPARIIKTQHTDSPLAGSAEARPVSYELPPLDEMQGCMQRRYVVMAALARQAQASQSKTIQPNP